MNKDALVRRLRPFLSPRYQCLQIPSRTFTAHAIHHQSPYQKETHDYRLRVKQLEEARSNTAEWYPRLDKRFSRKKWISPGQLEQKYGSLEKGEVCADKEVVFAGRVLSIRSIGKNLTFIDLEAEPLVHNESHSETSEGSTQPESQTRSDSETKGRKIQVEVNMQHIAIPAESHTWRNIIRHGDVYAVIGHPYRTERGALSIRATDLPIMLSPTLHTIPKKLDDAETRARAPHVDMLVNPSAIRTLRVRHAVERAITSFLEDDGFVKVVTPLLSARAGGAMARPFETEATEFQGEKLHLRIAPELWLKRLIIGGMQRVFEIGPAFRNEGVDLTHNPEFNICEFYETYATLDDLIARTEAMLWRVQSEMLKLVENTEVPGQPRSSRLPNPRSILGLVPGSSFKRIEFIPGLEYALGFPLPDLSSPTAQADLLEIFTSNNILIPANPTLPRLLDALAALHLEPQSVASKRPIFITHHPACMSPLAKTFICPKTKQLVSARAELFINGMECANMYEEQNDPFEQGRRFALQAAAKEASGAGDVTTAQTTTATEPGPASEPIDPEAMLPDEGFVRALEWGMPPTGGWGCGMDRLVMLFAGCERLADVFPFGSLRNVVALGKEGSREDDLKMVKEKEKRKKAEKEEKRRKQVAWMDSLGRNFHEETKEGRAKGK